MLFSTLILDMVSVSNNHESGQDVGVALLYKPYTYLLPQRVWFMHHFGGLKTLCPFWSGIGYDFQGNYGSIHVQMNLLFSILNE